MTGLEKHEESSLEIFFEHLAPKLLFSQCPVADKHILIEAWNVHTDNFLRARSKTRTKLLSLEKVFYVYALLDPRFPGSYTYTFLDKTFSLPFRPFYIGKGTKQRIKDHARLAKLSPARDRKTNLIRKLQSAGLQPVEIQLSKLEIEAVALAKEMALISAIGRIKDKSGPLLNVTPGGEGGSGARKGRIVSEETKEKIRKALLGKKLSEETRQKMSKSRTGKVQSAETRAKKSIALTGRLVSEFTRRKISEAQFGRIISEDTRRKLSAARKGKKKSLETRLRMSAASRKREALKRIFGNVPQE